MESRRLGTHSHVTLTANVCSRERFFKLPRDTEIAKLDLTLGVDQDVGRLDISMHDLQAIFQESKTGDDALGDAAEDVLGYTVAVQVVQAAGVHVLHAIVDARFDKESSIEFDNFRSDRSMQDIEFHDDGIEFGLIEFKADFL